MQLLNGGGGRNKAKVKKEEGDAAAAAASPLKWRKVLYDSNSKFADNYTPHAYFLDAIERNKNLHKYSLSECLRGGCQVAIQFNWALLFYLSYFAIQQDQITSFQLLAGAVAPLCLAGYAFLYYCTTADDDDDGLHSGPWPLRSCFKRVLIFVAFGLGLSPLLHRLTDTISTDTIYTTSACMLLVHLAFHDYGLQGGGLNALSLNAGLFAAVCLASRLPGSLDGFVLLSFAVEVFALLPMARMKVRGTVSSLVSTLVMSGATVTACKCVLSVATAWIAGATVLALTVLCPTLFVHWQTYKDTIHGPWDEAVPKIDPSTTTTKRSNR